MYVFFPNKEYKFLLFYDAITDNTQRVEKYKTELYIFLHPLGIIIKNFYCICA